MYATIHPISPFSAIAGTNIQFTWNGNQIFKVRCLIKDNESGDTVYDNTVSMMKQYYPLPSDSGLVNGRYYVAFITVFDIDGVESDVQSIGTPFYCLSTPTFSLSISDGDVIRSSTYSADLTYAQNENEELNSYTITLYTYQKTQLQSSGIVYSTTAPSYLLTDLENATQYYVRATGQTVNGIHLDTGYILFSVAYTQAQVWTPLELNNLPDIGAIEIRSNIVSALGVAPDTEVVYIDNKYVDLRNNSVTYDVGFEVAGNFSKAVVFYKPMLNKSILHFTGEGFEVDIYYRNGSYSDSDGVKAYFELVASNGISEYVQMSNYVDIPSADQMFALAINRENAFYSLKAVLIERR